MLRRSLRLKGYEPVRYSSLVYRRPSHPRHTQLLMAPPKPKLPRRRWKRGVLKPLPYVEVKNADEEAEGGNVKGAYEGGLDKSADGAEAAQDDKRDDQLGADKDVC